MSEVLLSDIVRKLLEEGIPPRTIRMQLASKGIHWSYSFSSHKDSRRVGHPGGKRERDRRLRQIKK